jgi:methionine synthase II (cobalamin-independent)
MAPVELNALPTMIGSMPQKNAESACEQVFHYLRDIPVWPQLPHRSYLENMYVQFSEGFPGVTINLEQEKIFVDRNQNLDAALEKLYAAYLQNDNSKFSISRDYAAGLYSLLEKKDLNVKAVKGQITGPVSWGMTVGDNNGRAVAYDDVLADACAKMLKLRASWMEQELRKISPNTIIFIDEPYLNSIGSAFFALSKEKVVSLIEETLSGISGLKGIHCCGNTDWSMVLSTGLDILGFDAFNYAQSLTLYPVEVKKFINRGGIIAWGIVPNQSEDLDKETLSSLVDRLEAAIAPFTRKGFDLPFKKLIKQSLISPSCGLPGLSPEGAERALELTAGLSERFRLKYSS